MTRGKQIQEGGHREGPRRDLPPRTSKRTGLRKWDKTGAAVIGEGGRNPRR